MPQSRPYPSFPLLFFLMAIAMPAGAGESLRGPARVVDAAMIEVDGAALQLYGIVAPRPGERCPYRSTEIDCGHVAATALMDLTAATPVVCEIIGEGDGDARKARCTAEGYDLSEGMVYTGWALPLPGAPESLASARRQAESGGHGLWRGAFPDRVIAASGQ